MGSLRGVGFVGGAKATYAMAKVSNLGYVVSAMLIEWVVFMGAVFSAIMGSASAALFGYLLCGAAGGCGALAIIGAILGCVAGCTAGGSSLSVVNSGAASILMCWAERPD